MNLIRMFQGTQKQQFYFNRDYGFEVTVKRGENQHFPCFDQQINNHLSWANYNAVIMFIRMLPTGNISYLSPFWCNF